MSAKKGTMLLASNVLYKSAGVVEVMLGGPRRPEDVTQTSRLNDWLSAGVSRTVKVKVKRGLEVK